MPVASSFHTNAWNTSNKSLAIYSNICLTVSSSQILLFTFTAMLLQICVCVCVGECAWYWQPTVGGGCYVVRHWQALFHGGKDAFWSSLNPFKGPAGDLASQAAAAFAAVYVSCCGKEDVPNPICVYVPIQTHFQKSFYVHLGNVHKN